MKKNFSKMVSGLCAASAVLALTACGGSKSYTVEGQIPEDLMDVLSASTVSIINFDGDTLAQDVIGEDGKFAIKGTVEEPFMGILVFEQENVALLIVEPGRISTSFAEEGAYITGTPQNDALNEYFTMANDLEQGFMQEMYASRSERDSLEADEQADLNDFAKYMNLYVAGLYGLRDSIYNANRDNQVGLYMALELAQSMSGADEAREKFGDNETLMSSPIMQRVLENLEHWNEEDMPDDFDPADIDSTDSAEADGAERF